MTTIVLIGEGALALHCLDALGRHDLSPALVCSFDGSLAEICTERGLPHVGTRDAVRTWMADQGCDYLLSVRNPWVLPAEVLADVRRLAINFHDSPLPRYAGLHATSWALLHGEREHGISWHEITPGIDEGRLLTQVRVPITDDDTAFTLNTKCLEAAAQAFDRVLDAISTDTPTFTPQTGERSYFGGADRPAAQGVIDPTEPASAIVNLVRALDFGHAPNPLGRPKLWLGDRAVVVRRAAVGEAFTSAPAGTLLRAEPDAVHLATGEGTVILSELSDLDGVPVDPSSLPALYPSATLPVLDAGQRDALSDLNRRVCRRERAWIRQLTAGIAAAEHPYAPTEATGALREAALPRLRAVLDPTDPATRGAFARAVVASYLARLGDDQPRDLGIVAPEVCGPTAASSAPALFAPVVPLRLPTAPGLSFQSFADELDKGWAALERRPTFARDLGTRAPALRGRRLLPMRWPVIMMMGGPLPEGPDALATMALLATLAPMVVGIDPQDGGVRLWAAETIDDDRLARIDAQLATLARAALDDPAHDVATLPLLDDAERERLLVTLNATHRPIPDACIHTLFEQQAQRTPQAPAVRFGDDRLSYQQLDARANQLAHALRARGVGDGDLVALAVGRSVEMIVGVLGILKAGAAYVPLDRSLPRERLELILRRSEPSLVVSDTAPPDAIAQCARPLLSVTDDAEFIADQPKTPPAATRDPEGLAYIIFTSGSTGEPKAVEIRHRSLVNHGLAVQDHYEFTAEDRILCSASIGFDVAAEQIYPALLHGAEIVVRPDDLMESFRGFDAFAREHALTVLALPTAFWHEWVRFLDARNLDVPPSLRALGVGTEKALGESLAVWRQRGAAHVRFIQGYGPTEATITCTMYCHEDDGFDPSRPLPIGRPLANTEIYLLDPTGAPVPVGMPGELCVGGLGLARGYRGRPDLTDERFVPHPFRSDGDARIYKTGDLARYEADGQIVFLGRSDFQVKIRGFRVELGEIETALRAHPDIDEAVVVLRDDPGLPKRLVAYLVGPDTIDRAGAQTRCRAQLPEYMVPADYVVLDAFPVTSNGKVDRAALPAPAATPAAAARATRNEVERRTAQEFAAVLGLAEVGPTDGFFALGGDSLRAMLLLDRLEGAFDVTLPLHRFFEADTVEAVAEHIRTADPHAHPMDEPAVITLKKGKGVPLYVILGVTMYAELADALAVDNPVYAIVQPVESEMVRHGTCLPSVQELARRNVELLRQHRPQGPYVLGGYSFGGFVAYEMAQQLQAEGAEVPLLVLFDCMLPRGRDVGLRDVVRGIGRAFRFGQVRPMLDKIERRAAQMLGLAAPAEPTATATAEPLSQSAAASMRAMRDGEYGQRIESYDRVILPYEGKVVLYRALAFRRPVMPGHGFEQIVRGRLVTHDVPGDHDTILRTDYVVPMARHLDRQLASLPRSTDDSTTQCRRPSPRGAAQCPDHPGLPIHHPHAADPCAVAQQSPRS
ncbi:MAG: amino acid adenylation domain-containing protein [Myxococcota bacterium]